MEVSEGERFFLEEDAESVGTLDPAYLALEHLQSITPGTEEFFNRVVNYIPLAQQDGGPLSFYLLQLLHHMVCERVTPSAEFSR